MLKQLDALSRDLETMTPVVDQAVRELTAHSSLAEIDKVFLIGNGDSHHASRAAEMAYEVLTEVSCEPLPAEHMLSYHLPHMSRESARRCLVIGVSVSGRSPRVLAALAAAREHGAHTLAVTGTHGSPVTSAAERQLVVSLPDLVPSPGIRTFQAMLLGLLVTAVRLAASHGTRTCDEADALCAEIRGLACAVDATNERLRTVCPDVALRVADAPVMAFLGSGPSLGTAMYGAAKLVEGAGVMAVGQDLEEWWHVERFARPHSMPIFVLAPPGRTHDKAIDVAARAAALGRHVYCVTQDRGTSATETPYGLLPVHGTVGEVFSPLLYHLFASRVAAHVAHSLGRLPFSQQ
ncbi:SIS domain-containing protein [Streptomyces rochei]|uniref:SIS domain-containing protein n=1 Tax=Streptomyces rochei TaxID=1928 RepID=UPI00369708D0